VARAGDALGLGKASTGQGQMSWRRTLEFGVAIVAVIVLTFAIVVALNLSGDCGAEVRNCGEGRRQISFVVLGIAPAVIAYLIYRLVRNPRGRG
jgi:hypothetical protein